MTKWYLIPQRSSQLIKNFSEVFNNFPWFPQSTQLSRLGGSLSNIRKQKYVNSLNRGQEVKPELSATVSTIIYFPARTTPLTEMFCMADIPIMMTSLWSIILIWLEETKIVHWHNMWLQRLKAKRSTNINKENDHQKLYFDIFSEISSCLVA